MIAVRHAGHYALLAISGLIAGCAMPERGPKPASLTTTLSATHGLAEAGPMPADQRPSPLAASAASYVSTEAPAAPTSSSNREPGPVLPPPASDMGSSLAADPAGAKSIPDAASQAAGSSSESDELQLDWLVEEVQSRNPSIRAATEAWRAAAQRYPQVVSLEDPMFGFLVSTANVGSNEGEAGYMLDVSQRIPWPGKRRLRGGIAAAEADVMQGEIGVTRLRLAEAAKSAYFDYYQAQRQMEVIDATTELLKQFRQIAQSKYEVNQATQQDVLQAEVELAELAARRSQLQRDRQVAVARINTLLHQPAGCPLPPASKDVPPPQDLPSIEILQQMAINSRPDLFAQGARIRAEEANLALQCKEFYPDLELVARYDATMEDERMRPMVGMNVNVPVQHQRRRGAVREAYARIQQRRAEFNDRVDQVRFDVQSAHDRLAQGRQVLRLFSERILPAAQESLKSAQANYTTGKIDFLRLLDAERQLNNQRQGYYQAQADYHRRLAELERAVGEPLADDETDG